MKTINVQYSILSIFLFGFLLLVSSHNSISNAISLEEHENLQYMIPINATVNSQQSLNDTSVINNISSPIPDIAKGPAIPSKGYLVEEIRDNL